MLFSWALHERVCVCVCVCVCVSHTARLMDPTLCQTNITSVTFVICKEWDNCQYVSVFFFHVGRGSMQ